MNNIGRGKNYINYREVVLSSELEVPLYTLCKTLHGHSLFTFLLYVSFTVVYTNLLFQVHFYGVHDCPEWVVSKTLLFLQ